MRRLSLRKIGAGRVTLSSTNTLLAASLSVRAPCRWATPKPSATSTTRSPCGTAVRLNMNGQSPANYTRLDRSNGTGVYSTGGLLNSSATNGGSSSLEVALGSDSRVGVTGAGSLTVGADTGQSLLNQGRFRHADRHGRLTPTRATPLSTPAYCGFPAAANRLPVGTAVTLANTPARFCTSAGTNQTIGSLSGGGANGGNVARFTDPHRWRRQ